MKSPDRARPSPEISGFGIFTCAVLICDATTKFNLIGRLYSLSRHRAAWPVEQLFLVCVCLGLVCFVATLRRSAELARERERRERAEDRAGALAAVDPLTGLANRQAFAQALGRAIDQGRRDLAACTVLLVDLDRFKPINDLMGRSAGDSVLCEVAERLGGAVATSALIARTEGDEFAVLMEHELGDEAPLELAERLIAAASRPGAESGLRLGVGCTVGVATCPADATDAEGLLHAAKVALDEAKRGGPGRVQRFHASMGEALHTRAVLESDLREAIAAREIKPFFQPVFGLGAGTLLGFEILARWDHPARGQLTPDLFIPVVEASGLIGELTAGMLRQACEAAQAWPDRLTLALNVSPSQLADRGLPRRLLAILDDSGLASEQLEIEVTENALVQDLPAAREVLLAFQAAGVNIALDDFGSGYSSLHHLRELRFDKIKIDRAFVMAMEQSADSAKIVSAIVGLSKSLGLTTTAEGIETHASLGRLTRMGCDFGQGYYLGSAMPAAEAAALAGARSAARVPVLAS